MAIKITKNIKGILTIPKNVSKNFSREIKSDMEAEIVGEILQGKSPVRNHRFPEYSDDYAKKKGAKRPVNLNESGRLLGSAKVSQQTGSGKISFEFTDKKADWHHNGKGKNPKRRMLPTKKNEKFNVKLTKFLNRALRKAVIKEVKKQR